jgi:hypothetical protein
MGTPNLVRKEDAPDTLLHGPIRALAVRPETPSQT